MELRSLLYRMKVLRKRRYYIYGLDLGPYIQQTPDGPRNLYTRTRACIDSIENFVEGHPWATMVDIEIYRDAWVAGAEWSICTQDSYKLER